jgi:hypothetical protein
MGKPAIPIVSGRFENDVKSSARAFGMPGLQYVIVPRIYRNLALDLCVSQTEEVIDDIIRVLTTNGTGAGAVVDRDYNGTEAFEGEDRFACVQHMNEAFIERDWGDGYPLLPPTREAVEALLEGTCLEPDQLVCDMPPGFGLATVEKIAINAAMAGALPEHMPVIIGAIKALSQMGRQGGAALLMSTSPNAPILVANGPITRELGINARSALGPGRDNRVNITIGRAFYLCLKNIGYWYPNQMDMDTIGTTRKFVLCVAENEEESPWPPFHVDRGFKAEESTVSVFITDGEVDVQDQGNTSAEALLKNLAYGATFGTRGFGGRTEEGGGYGGPGRIIFMPPDVAKPVGAQGFSKEAAKEFIHKHANISLGKATQYMPIDDARVPPSARWIQNLTEEQRLQIMVPMMGGPSSCNILVIGADRAKTLIMPGGNPQTVGVDQYRA